MPTPSGRPVDVVTDQDGNYDFTLTVGTVPGPFELSAWAKSTWTGELIAGDVAWDEQTLSLTAPGSVKYDAFLTTLSALHGTAEASSSLGTMVNDAASIAQALPELGRSRNMLGGLAFSMVNGSAGGPAVLVYDDDSPPTVKANGDVVAGGRTWVLSPGEWKGTAKLGGVLSTVVQTGKLQWAPTYTEWAKGTQVQGWSLSKNSASLGTTEPPVQRVGLPEQPCRAANARRLLLSQSRAEPPASVPAQSNLAVTGSRSGGPAAAGRPDVWSGDQAERLNAGGALDRSQLARHHRQADAQRTPDPVPC